MTGTAAVGRIVSGGFAPAPWLRNPHLQTLLANKPLRWPAGPSVADDRLELPDGDVVRLVRGSPAAAGRDTPIVVVLHGLAGGYDSAYARELFSALAAHGLEGHMLHFRGCGGVPNRLPRGYHAGDTADLAWYLRRLRERHPARRIAAVGYSLGANVLLKYLGEAVSESLVDAAVGVSVPFDLQNACESISQGFSVLYHKVLLSRLKQAMRERFLDATDAPFDLARLREARTLVAFDDLVTAPIHGFASADHYYRTSSCRQFLRYIRTPTLILHALDDPFQSHAGIPARHELAAPVTLELPPHGGHVGFLEWRREPARKAPPAGMAGSAAGAAAADEVATIGEGGWGLRSWLPGRITSWLQDAVGIG